MPTLAIPTKKSFKIMVGKRENAGKYVIRITFNLSSGIMLLYWISLTFCHLVKD